MRLPDIIFPIAFIKLSFNIALLLKKTSLPNEGGRFPRATALIIVSTYKNIPYISQKCNYRGSIASSIYLYRLPIQRLRLGIAKLHCFSLQRLRWRITIAEDASSFHIYNITFYGGLVWICRESACVYQEDDGKLSVFELWFNVSSKEVF